MSKIIRAKRESKSFALVDKNFINDKRLSYKAKGILVYILSKPDDWKVVIRDLINNAADGKASIYAGLKELERYGYYVKEPVRDEDGRRILDWTSIVYEVPVFDEKEEVEKEAASLAEKYQMEKEEFLKQFGGLDMIQYDLEMRKTIDSLKEFNK